MRLRATGLLLGVLLLAGTSGGGAIWAAVPTTAPAKSVAQLVADAGSADFAAREAATRALMKLPPDQLPKIEAALAHTSNEEAITRLEKAAVHLYMKQQITLAGPVGLMGVRMSSEMVQLDPKSAAYTPCIVVWKTQPGFPAAEVLEPADRVIAVNGKGFPNADPDVFRKIVNDAGGGAVLALTLIRNGKVMDVKVTLAGLREEEKATLVQIVDARDRAAEDYRASLKTGRTAALAAQRDPAGQVLQAEGLNR